MQRLSLCLAVVVVCGLAGCERAEKAAGEEQQATKVPEPTSVQTASADPVVVWATDSPMLQWGACPEPLPAGCQLAVLHGNPAQPNSDVLLRIPAGSVIPPHTHSSAERMMLVSGQLDVRYLGAQPARLLPGTYTYGPARRPHMATCMAAEPCVLFIAFEGPVDVMPYEGGITGQ